MADALVLLSGGQDSATCLAQALSDFPSGVEALCIDYQQRHSIEIQQAAALAQLAGVPFECIKLPFLSKLTENALTRETIAIEHQEGELPSTFVEGRNLFFLSVAAVRAKQKGMRFIYAGMCQTDYSGYPDCRDDFIKSLNQTVNMGLDTSLEIRTPLMWLTKAETVLLMDSLGRIDWYKETHTCYEGKRPACGVCPACQLRLRGFSEAGIQDPIAYQ